MNIKQLSPEDLELPIILSMGETFPDFSCGEEGVDEFIHQQALDYQKENLGITYIFKHSGRLIGFATISMGDLNKDKMEAGDRLPQSIPNYPILLIGQIGVCEDQQRGGIGKHICDFCIDRALKLSEKIGCRFVVVNAVPKEEVIRFYEDKIGFKMLPKQEKGKQKTMILNIHTYKITD